jgi:DNA polymerase-1
LHPRLTEAGLDRLYHDIELPLARVLARMELWGIRLDPHMLQDQSRKFAQRIGHLEAQIHECAGGPFNVGSTKQLGEILFDRLALPTGKKTKTGYSTDQAVLEGLAHLHPLPKLVLEYRHLTKLKSTYLDTLPSLIHPATGRLHTSFRQAVAATGRLSSSDPNLQNIPIRTSDGRDIRRAFIAEPGWRLLSADYSQIELRVLAHVSGDPGLRAAFADGADVHARTAAQVFRIPQAEVTPEQRRQAKAINFGLIYGMGAFRLAGELGIPQGEAKRIIDRYFEQYPGVKAFFERVLAEARGSKSVRTLFGRVRSIPEIDATNGTLRQGAERVALNTPIQGTAADLLKVAMIRLDAALETNHLRSRVLLTVHDELVLEVPEDELETVPALVRKVMESAGDGVLDVPLVVEMGTGRNWAEIH